MMVCDVEPVVNTFEVILTILPAPIFIELLLTAEKEGEAVGLKS